MFEKDITGVYFREISGKRLLTHDEEVDFAKKIEEGKIAEKNLLMLIKGKNPFSAKKNLLALLKGEKIYWILTNNESELLRIIKVGEEAKQKLVEANLKLVVSIAKRYVGGFNGLTLLDLIGEGNLGLLAAAEKFDWKFGARFSTYATWRINQFILRSLDNKSRFIRIPVDMLTKISKYRKARKKLLSEFGREPTQEEIAQVLEWSIKNVRSIGKREVKIFSLETLVAGESEQSINDFMEEKNYLSPSEKSYNLCISRILENALSKLNPQEREVVSLRFGLCDGEAHTLKEIGNMLGLTKERIRQIQVSALEKLKKDNSLQSE